MTANTNVEQVTIAGPNLAVSRVGLGTWAIGGWMWGGTDDTELIATIYAAIERGVNLIDTAPAYGFGRSEEIVGRAIAERRLRSRVVIATKTGSSGRTERFSAMPAATGFCARLRTCLRRLRTDYIDIYQVHWPDPLVPVEETAEAMQTLFDQGKIRAIGVSNFSVAQIERFRRVAKLHVVQPPYNLFEREIENELLPYCRQSGLATLTYGALCRGLLSGKLQEDAHFDGDDLRLTDPKFQPPPLCAISHCGSPSRSICSTALRQAGHPLGCALAARPGRDCGTLGSASSRPAAADRRGIWMVARCRRKDRDRLHPARVDHRSGGPRVHGAAPAFQCRSLGSGAVACWRRAKFYFSDLRARRALSRRPEQRGKDGRFGVTIFILSHTSTLCVSGRPLSHLC